MQQQRQDFPTKSDGFNLVLALVTAHQRALTVPFRTGYGSEALGFPGLWAFLLILMCAVFSFDPMMWIWLAFWMISLIVRRMETAKMLREGWKIHSMYDGTPTMMPSWGEKCGRWLVEPVVFVLLGLITGFISRELGTPPGLAFFLLAGGLSLPAVEGVRRMLINKRTQAMLDSRLEQEFLMEQYKERWGE
jgi:hypothetical protein